MANETDATRDQATQIQRPARGAGRSGDTHIDVIGLVTSAGGLEAISSVLRALPADFSAAIVVAQHLGGQGSQLVAILERRIALPVRWARDGESIRAGEVTVCPVRSALEILPDRTCALRKIENSLDRPLDLLLSSLAESFGASALGVVLTGMGSDGARGVAALKRVGGTVFAQSEETAEHPSMPRAAIGAGVDLVLPLHEIGKVIGEVVSGARLPRPRSEIDAADSLFAGTGKARAELRQIDWSATPLGPVTGWSPALCAIVRAVLDNDFPMFAMWGPDLVQIGNDAYAPTLGNKQMQGLPVRTTWAELWDFVRPQFEQIRRTGEPIYAEDVHFSLNRRGFVEEAYFTYCYSPLHDDGRIAGILNTSLETTARVLADRRLASLRALATAGAGIESTPLACERSIQALAENSKDIPFALVYLHDHGRDNANLCAWTGVEAGSVVAPRTLDVRRGHVAWPLGRVLTEGTPLVVDDLPARFSAFHAGPWPEPPNAAALLPLRSIAGEAPVGVLVAGYSARLAVDEAYRGFFDLVAKQISASLAEARTRQRERERMERLAELDRVKTEFFSNVSHEFRTPLTLMLGPLEELLRRRADLPPAVLADVQVAARNSRRLLALVNTLLDFSQIEAGRLRAHFEPIDLAELTADIASAFRSAVERAGLRFLVDCPELPERVWVDGGMWEKIVSNLVANAIKFTFDGEIEVRLRALPKHAELVVRDTGVGIPLEEQSQIFKRFHRVRASRARTHEGAGIGLALVSELVRLHHGRVRVQSEPGQGSTFTVWVPLGKRVVDDTAPDTAPVGAGVAETLAEEASAWSAPGSEPALDGVLPEALGAPSTVEAIARGAGASILVAEDNADMRDYLHRLLSPYWHVALAVDGQDALERARLVPPDLVLADVMMPRLDGFGLLAALRADETLRGTSVILVTAWASEEAAIQGLLAGADDCVAKPFSARELIARIGGQVELARLRRRTAELNELLVRFSDAVRGLSDPKRVAEAACGILTERLATERTVWADIDWGTREYATECVVFADGSPGAPSRWPLDAREPFAAEHLAGRPVVYVDVETDRRIPRRLSTEMAERGNGAGIAVPVVVDGTLRGVLTTSQRASRRWTADELAFVEALAGRTWAELERARAETALHASEARYRALATASADVIYRMSPDWREMRQLDGRGFLSDTAAPSGSWLERYIHPDDRARVTAAIDEAVREKRVFELEHRVVRADGTLGWTFSRAVPMLDDRGEIVEWIGAASDATARKDAEAMRRNAEEVTRES